MDSFTFVLEFYEAVFGFAWELFNLEMFDWGFSFAQFFITVLVFFIVFECILLPFLDGLVSIRPSSSEEVATAKRNSLKERAISGINDDRRSGVNSRNVRHYRRH